MTIGWIKLHREIQDNKFWLKERFTKAQAWIDLILLAHYSDEKLLVGYKNILIKRGEILTSQRKLAKRWQWARKSVDLFLKFLELSKKIDRKVDHKIQYGFTIITIQNYNRFQDIEPQSRSQGGHKVDHKVGHKVYTVKKVKKDKNIKKDINVNRNLVSNNNITGYINLISRRVSHFKKNKNVKPAQIGKIATKKRKEISYSKEVIDDIVMYYVEKKVISPQGNEWLPIQQAVKTMLMNGRNTQNIKDFIYWLSKNWATWDIHTVMKRMPEFLADKLDREKNRINHLVADEMFQRLLTVYHETTGPSWQLKNNLIDKINEKYPLYKFEREWQEAKRILHGKGN